jgi:hypothetical protein
VRECDRGKLVKETEWTRVYEVGGWMCHESKFMTDGLKVSAESIKARWPTFSFEEKLDFANAFGAGGKVTAEDERILDFLMEAGDFPIWMAIAGRLRHHRDKDRVLAFLLERVKAEDTPKGNFFQALGWMNDKRALPALRATFDGYRRRLGASPTSGVSPNYDYTDYLACCVALWKISGSLEYKQVIDEALKSQDDGVRNTAGLLLRNA